MRFYLDPSPTLPEPILDSLSPEDRAEYPYYHAVFGVEVACHWTPYTADGTSFKWEQVFPLENDPALKEAGIEIAARVEVWAGDFVIPEMIDQQIEDTPFELEDEFLGDHYQAGTHNRILVRRGAVERHVACTHTIVEKVPSESDEIPISSGIPAPLSPIGHFAALKSFVAFIAETGIVNCIQAYYETYETKPLAVPTGLNAAMQAQLIWALKKVAPDIFRPILRKLFLDVVESLSRDHFRDQTSAFLVWNLFDLDWLAARDPDFFFTTCEIFGEEHATDFIWSVPNLHPQIREFLNQFAKNSV